MVQDLVQIITYDVHMLWIEGWKGFKVEANCEAILPNRSKDYINVVGVINRLYELHASIIINHTKKSYEWRLRSFKLRCLVFQAFVSIWCTNTWEPFVAIYGRSKNNH